MLTDLFIRNLTLIERLELSFNSGLTVFTGETGAGKSILLDALMLVMGGRANMDSIREGADELEVIAGFFLDDIAFKRTNETLLLLGLSALEDPTLIIRKVVARHGRHKQLVNGLPISVAQLKEIAEPLIDFTGQHAQQVLLQPKGQLALLDAFAGNDELLEQMAKAHADLNELKQRKNALSLDENTRLARIDWLHFQINEIDQVAPKSGEMDELKHERERLLNAEKLKEESERALGFLSDREGGTDALSKVQEASKALQRATRYHDWFANLVKNLDGAAAFIDDAVVELNRYLDKFETNTSRLSWVEERFFDIQRLMRKHGGSIDEVLAKTESMRSELDHLQSAEVSLAKLEREIEAALGRCEKTAEKLSLSRQEAGEKLVKAVENEVFDLGMSHAHFEVDIRPHLDADKKLIFTATGADIVRLLFSPNPGEQMHSLEKIASGGELSRVMLGIKRVLLTKDLTLVSIFDEVDAGVGGAMGEAIGEKLQKIAEGRQVLCVTHLAQVAARAHGHMKVEKHVVGGRTLSSVKPLEHDARIEELARMMGGRQVTELTRRHAQEFLERAQEISL